MILETTPVPQVQFVFVAILPMSIGEFQRQQSQYLASVASMANVDISLVTVVSVTEISLRRGGRGGRSLLAVGVEVETAILTSSAQRDSLAQTVSQDALDRELVKNGLPKSFALTVKSGAGVIQGIANPSVLVSLVSLPLGLLLICTGFRVLRLYKRRQVQPQPFVKVLPLDGEDEPEGEADEFDRCSSSDSERVIAIGHSAGTTGSVGRPWLLDEFERLDEGDEEQSAARNGILAYSEPDLNSTVVGKHGRDTPLVEQDRYIDNSNQLWILHEVGWSLSRDILSQQEHIPRSLSNLQALPRRPTRLLPIAGGGKVHPPPWEKSLRLSPTAFLFLNTTIPDDLREPEARGPLQLQGRRSRDEDAGEAEHLPGSSMLETEANRQHERDVALDLALMPAFDMSLSQGLRTLKKLPRGFRD
ncbi:hypothetical protein GUITHDRAFT_109679 [Guillardia theta CCMP2712]|uniref:Uncharacterized protein n=1 Tax=Guillardia theta (strain CCMP2712) TaxID=905079 RepID=L1J913_GUITC|nr:hypothetical protein GUITHDRAFT_109679 [Guillardia theta CCMP2712]EKX44565.1 hypothetical protein GUITHDRAFT_109679 [Guillardia theta CCMP2712]|eukprot:XP_005831545.1 hypothetical protein GUITHDRAFT_109679 [Guillardia theta CCMP2712]